MLRIIDGLASQNTQREGHGSGVDKAGSGGGWARARSVARIREVQVSGSLPASPLPVITSDDTEKPGLELERAGGVADIGL